ncbi:MAG: DUF4870 domain-containing protein [Candidatus Woesearchaeota archaeon]
MNDDSKMWAFLGTFLTWLGFVIVLLAKKDDKYALYYAKQGLVVGILGIAISFVGWFPFIGWVTAPILGLLVFILWIVSWINALSGTEKPLPVLQPLVDKITV